MDLLRCRGTGACRARGRRRGTAHRARSTSTSRGLPREAALPNGSAVCAAVGPRARCETNLHRPFHLAIARDRHRARAPSLPNTTPVSSSGSQAGVAPASVANTTFVAGLAQQLPRHGNFRDVEVAVRQREQDLRHATSVARIGVRVCLGVADRSARYCSAPPSRGTLGPRSRRSSLRSGPSIDRLSSGPATAPLATTGRIIGMYRDLDEHRLGTAAVLVFQDPAKDICELGVGRVRHARGMIKFRARDDAVRWQSLANAWRPRRASSAACRRTPAS